MIKSQQSEDENEGFFKPQSKVVQFKQPILKDIEPNPNEQEPNDIVNQARPNDFQARILTHFPLLNSYPEMLMHNKCQQAKEQLISLPKNTEKVSRKYATLQEKYRDNQKYKMVYSKLADPKDFSSYIFSLEALTDYNPNHYTTALPPQNSEDNNMQSLLKGKQTQFVNSQSQFVFDSSFQSGNLLYAFRNIQENMPTFDLVIQNDTNTKGYNQWFYFSIVKNASKLLCQDQNNPNNSKSQKKTIKINIVNFIKKHLMFEDGVRPVGLYESEGDWKFIGRQTQYKKSFIKRYIEFNGSTVTKNYYTLSFLIDFPEISQQKQQKLYLALNYPYPFKRVISFIDKIINENRSEDVSITKQTLCHTISNNQVPYLIISTKITKKQIQSERKILNLKRQKEKEKLIDQYPENQLQQILKEQSDDEITDDTVKKGITDKKKKILILARQHPGQTVGSFVLEGFLRHLINGINQKVYKPEQNMREASESPRLDKGPEGYKKLLKEFSIYVFPMINVDGVIYGNFRTNIVGSDLNRQWIEPNKWLHPQIYYLKKFVSSMKNIEFVLDFHGHSRKLNSFIYACNNPVPTLLEGQDENDYPNIHMFRLYPYLMSKQCDLFSIKDCTYTISRDKIKTARINTFRNLNYNPYVFTFQTGFFGYTRGEKKFRYNIEDFFKIGQGALQSLKIVLLKPKKVKQILKEVQAKGYLFDKWTFENKQDPGSESNPSEDELNPVQKKAKVISDDKIREKQKNTIKIKPIPQKKNVRKKSKNKRTHRKIQTQLKSQRTILKIQDDGFKFISESKPGSKPDSNEEKKQKTPKIEKTRPLKIQYLNDKKKNTSREMANAVSIKEAIMQKVQFQLPQPNYRERVIRVAKKQKVEEDFKSASNLLGTGFHYFQNRGHKLPDHPLKTNPATLEMLEVLNFRKDIRIQSFSSGPSHENIGAKVTQNTSFNENSIKDLFFSLSKPNQKPVYSRKGPQKQRIYVVRENKIVKIVNNVSNASKQKSKSTMLESELKERQINLKKCQAMMESDNKTLIDEIKEQKVEEKRKKRVFLNPIQY